MSGYHNHAGKPKRRFVWLAWLATWVWRERTISEARKRHAPVSIGSKFSAAQLWARGSANIDHKIGADGSRRGDVGPLSQGNAVIEQFDDLAFIGNAGGEQDDLETRHIIGNVRGVEIGKALGGFDKTGRIDAQGTDIVVGQFGNINAERCHVDQGESSTLAGDSVGDGPFTASHGLPIGPADGKDQPLGDRPVGFK